MIAVTYLLYPLVLYLRSFIHDVDVWGTIVHTTGPEQTWFCLQLVLANVAFAAVWSIKPGSRDVRIRQWFERNLRFDGTLYFWALGLGMIVTLENYYIPSDVSFLARPGMGPGDSFSARIPYVFLGIYAGHAKWHEQIHAFARASKQEVLQSEQLLKTRKMMKCSVWMLGIMMVATLGVIGGRIAILKEDNPLRASSSFLINALQCTFSVLMTLAFVLVMVNASYRWLDIRPNALTKFLVRSMYAVFLFHIVVLICVQALWIAILRGIFGITLEYDDAVDSFVGLSQGTLFASFLFIFIVTNLIVWPLSYIICRLPLVNRIL